MNTSLCDLCGSLLEAVYPVPDSERRLTVCVCTHCGLIQSLPRIAHVEDGEQSTSSGPGWGNLRYGKRLRVEATAAMLNSHVDWEAVKVALDVGASRGDFTRWLAGKGCAVWAVEPDESLANGWAWGTEGVNPLPLRIENVELPPQSFDLIHCSHTLEHLASPTATLSRLWLALRPRGWLFVEVPDVAGAGRENVVEEWFIDKHLYHFSVFTLRAMVEACGFEIIRFYQDGENLSIVATRGKVGYAPAVTGWGRQLLARYALSREPRAHKVAEAAAHINALAGSKRVVVWGGGRIFDALVAAGLDTTKLAGLVDTYLPLAVVHGLDVLHPYALRDLACDVVVIASRAYADEIESEARKFCKTADVMVWDRLSLRH